MLKKNRNSANEALIAFLGSCETLDDFEPYLVMLPLPRAFRPDSNEYQHAILAHPQSWCNFLTRSAQIAHKVQQCIAPATASPSHTHVASMGLLDNASPAVSKGIVVSVLLGMTAIFVAM